MSSSIEFQRSLEILLDKEYSEKLDHLAASAASDFADYKYRCGYLRSITEIKEMCKRVAQELYGG